MVKCLAINTIDPSNDIFLDLRPKTGLLVDKNACIKRCWEAFVMLVDDFSNLMNQSIVSLKIEGDFVELLTTILIFPTGLTALTASSIPLNFGFATCAP